jgi:hypothetical protein
MPSKASSQVLTDHDEIQRWAEQRGAKPSAVRRTGGGNDIGMIRLDFPGYSGADSLEEVTWDDWFDKFDESNLALIVQEKTARGQKSNFNKLVSRDSVVQSSSQGSRGSSGRKTAARRSTGTRASKSTAVRGSSRSAGRTSSTASKSRSGGQTTRRASRKKASSSNSRSTSRKRSAVSSIKRSGGSTRGKRTQSVRGRNSKSSGRRAA